MLPLRGVVARWMCPPFFRGRGGAHLQRACVASVPTHHPEYSLLGFRVLPPNPPSKEGFRVVWDAIIHPSPKLCVTQRVGVPLRGFDDSLLHLSQCAIDGLKIPLRDFEVCIAATHALWWEGECEGVGVACLA